MAPPVLGAPPSTSREKPTRFLAPLLFALLVLASVVAFAHAQKVKHVGLLVDRVKMTRDFSPNGDGVRDLAFIRFRLTREDHVDVSVINDKGATVRHLDEDAKLPSYHYWLYIWDGKTDPDAPLPAGVYRVKVVLRGEGRDLVLRKKINLQLPGSKG
jgi:flagellar hook assembly protein FlgD